MDISEFRILLDGEESIPVGMQLKNQLKYMINSRQLPGGVRLPPVRVMASQLGLSAGTVAQVYRELQLEGLVVGEQGRGTFVRSYTQVDEVETMRRQALLDQALGRALTRAWSLGFEAGTVRQHIRALLGMQPGGPELAAVFPLRSSAELYSRRISSVLGDPDASVRPIELAALQEARPAVLEVFDTSYYAVTLVHLVPLVEEALQRHDIEAKVVGITAELTPVMLETFRQLPPDGKYAVVTEQRNIYTLLNVIQSYSRIDYRKVRKITDGQPEDLREACEWADRVLYTSGVEDLIESQALPRHKLLPVEFTISEDSASRLRRLFRTPTGNLIPA